MAFRISRSKALNEEQSHEITAIAIDGDKNSQSAVKWAADNLWSNKDSQCILVHVQSKTLGSKDMETVPKEGRPPTQQELQQFFLPYRGFCARKGIEAKEVVLHDIDVPSALTDFVVHNSISTLVVGASNRNALTRKFRHADVPSTLVKSVPEFCTVYVISRGKIQTSRSSSTASTPRLSQTPTINAATFGKCQTSTGNASPLGKQTHNGLSPSLPTDSPHSEDVSRRSFSPASWKSEGSDKMPFDRSSDSMSMRPLEKPRYGHKIISPGASTGSSSAGVYNGDSMSDVSETLGPISFLSADMSESAESSVASGSPRSSNSSQMTISMEAELLRLKLELKQSMEMYSSVCKEAVLAKQMAKDFHHLQELEAQKLEEAKLAEEAALSIAETEKQKSKAAVEAAVKAQWKAEKEARKRKDAEKRIERMAKEKRKVMETLAQSSVPYRKYAIDEIEVATDRFARHNKIGEGGFGPVYKGMLNHTAVAIKVLRPNLSQGQKQFQQEVEVLSSIRHPHMVLLLGACPEDGCLVYEYMENGSLEDRLFRKDNTPSIPWRTRFKIASDIATALLFLHETKPEPLVHRDLKPANILLDNNYVSKIADVGLARLLPSSNVDNVTQYRLTAAAGTFCYIDPEYQRRGKLTVRSDIYSLGVVLLQLITAMPPMGLSHQVEEAIEKGRFSEVLDPTVPDWPVEEALSLAKLGLHCCELTQKGRPDLASVVLPELNRLRDIALATEADQPQTIPEQHGPDNSSPEWQNDASQMMINAKGGRNQRFTTLTNVLSFTGSSGNEGSGRGRSRSRSRSNLPPTGGNKAHRKSSSSVFGCWSFASCASVPHASQAPIERLHSFS